MSSNGPTAGRQPEDLPARAARTAEVVSSLKNDLTQSRQAEPEHFFVAFAALRDNAFSDNS
jgi:hypothetical protein